MFDSVQDQVVHVSHLGQTQGYCTLRSYNQETGADKSPNKPDYAGYDAFTTPCSFDASDGGNGSATTTPSYADALAKTASESIEAIVRIGGYCLRDS